MHISPDPVSSPTSTSNWYFWVALPVGMFRPSPPALLMFHSMLVNSAFSCFPSNDTVCRGDKDDKSTFVFVLKLLVCSLRAPSPMLISVEPCRNWDDDGLQLWSLWLSAGLEFEISSKTCTRIVATAITRHLMSLDPCMIWQQEQEECHKLSGEINVLAIYNKEKVVVDTVKIVVCLQTEFFGF